MPSQTVSSIENNFTKGLITESTGLNFPENAATDCDNVMFEIIGDVTRRLGFDTERNYSSVTNDVANNAQSSYIWNNPGGDSVAKILVRQVGKLLYLYSIDTVNTGTSISQRFITTIDVTQYAISAVDNTKEFDYADGNGYLFVYHPSCDPFYLTYSPGQITSFSIKVQVRDLLGADEGGVPVNTRPVNLTAVHNYNLVNQGWVSGSPWTMISVGTGPAVDIASLTFTVPSGVTGVVNGQFLSITTTHDTFPGGIGYLPAGTGVMTGTVTGYTGTSLTVNVTVIYPALRYSQLGPYQITPVSSGYINTWNASIGNYPSNADVWWYYKNASGVFDPATTNNNITLNTGSSPKGHFIIDAFNQQRSIVSGVSGITDVTTTVRPRTGAWFQGRVWYAGVDSSQAATGNALFYSWTENIYFSQIVLTGRDFGNCYQTNDATSENLNGILPTDGGVVTISGSGKIYKLFPIANGLLVFASNGIWFITGSQGIGFSANDYTITQISKIKCISGTSFVDVQGLPYFWNEEGIYQITPTQSGQLTVEPITVGTILTFYSDIPLSSKQYAKGAYDPVNYRIQWIYRAENEAGLNDRYAFDKMMNFNTFNKSFYPYSLSSGSNNERISTINYVAYNTSVSAPPPGFKYGSSFGPLLNASVTFAEEYQDSYLDWETTSTGVDYSSYFVTGYKLHGQGQRRFQIPYIYMYSRNKGFPVLSYSIQGIWDYANNRNSGRWSTAETVTFRNDNFDMLFKRHKMRGMGITLQFKIQSVTGYPFDIMGWSVYENVNQGI